jgi:hypothetical protein
MSRRNSQARRPRLLPIAPFLVLAAFLASRPARAERAEPRPDRIVILADDPACGDVGCHGQRRIRQVRNDRSTR